MMKLKWFSILVTIAVFILASLATGCTPSTPSSPEPTETPSATETPQQAQPTEEAAEEPAVVAPPTAPVTKQALFVIYNQFEETEYGKPLTALKDAGIEITVASTSLDTVRGHNGKLVKPDVALKEVHGDDYDAVVFIGGYGYSVDDIEAQRIAQEAATEGKVVAAICIAPITLAKAGLLKGKKATSSINSWIQSEGAITIDDPVVRDGIIITANGPDAAKKFGETIVTALQE
jgi:protease I